MDDVYCVMREVDWDKRDKQGLAYPTNPAAMSLTDASALAGRIAARDQIPVLVLKVQPVSRHVATVAIAVEPIV